jgi:hypothetical protein
MTELQILEENREQILLAEVAALLHDVGKFCDAFMEKQARIIPRFDYKQVLSSGNTTRPKIADFLNASFQSSLNKTCTILGSSYRIADLIMKGKPGYAAGNDRHNLPDEGWLPAMLGVCHGEAHYDKQDATQSQSPPFLVSTSFGYEKQTFWIGDNDPQRGLTSYLQIMHPIPTLTSDIPAFLTNVRNQFQRGLGDTRIPTNEVTLDDWSFSVATLFKAAIASALLNNNCTDIRQYIQRPEIDHDLQWRTLRISYDGLAFLERAPTIGDLLARQKALHTALDEVRKLFEYTYPLGNEIYRDENGSAFIVPALEGDNDNGDMLHGLLDRLIYGTFRKNTLKGEVEPHIKISKASKEAKELHTLLQYQPPPPRPFVDAMQCWWEGEPADICTVCGVRSQGWGAPDNYHRARAQERNVCYPCWERRENRAKAWATGRLEKATNEQQEQWKHTIWVDEVADTNGRLALIVGRFDLDDWLSGEMIPSMLVVCDPANADPEKRFIPKNPSFARIQRVWRTTKQFWDDVWSEDIPQGMDNKTHSRLEVEVSAANGNKPNLAGYFAYDAMIDGKRLSVVWNKQRDSFITADNVEVWGGITSLKKRLKQMQDDQTPIPLSIPGGYGKQRQLLAPVIIKKVRCYEGVYTPAVKLLTEPRSFMALVPANTALAIANRIRERYECEMSKVRNRLPLFLGLVFFGRRQPLFSALDAGRRMLEIEMPTRACMVHHVQSHTSPPESLRCSQPNHFNTWQELLFHSTEHKQNEQNEQYRWQVSTVMGDGTTSDDWYPYIRVLSDKTGKPVSGRKQFSLPAHPDQQWVHVADVQTGDTVWFTPSRFSYIYLDTSARRFEVVAPDATMPLEELARISVLWEKLKELAEEGKLSESKLHAIVALLSSKEEEWQDHTAVYINFATAVLRKEGLSEQVTDDDITSRRLLKTFELYQQILKERLQKPKENQE